MTLHHIRLSLFGRIPDFELLIEPDLTCFQLSTFYARFPPSAQHELSIPSNLGVSMGPLGCRHRLWPLSTEYLLIHYYSLIILSVFSHFFIQLFYFLKPLTKFKVKITVLAALNTYNLEDLAKRSCLDKILN